MKDRINVRNILNQQLADKQVAFVSMKDPYWKGELKKEIAQIKKKLAKLNE